MKHFTLLPECCVSKATVQMAFLSSVTAMFIKIPSLKIILSWRSLCVHYWIIYTTTWALIVLNGPSCWQQYLTTDCNYYYRKRWRIHQQRQTFDQRSWIWKPNRGAPCHGHIAEENSTVHSEKVTVGVQSIQDCSRYCAVLHLCGCCHYCCAWTSGRQ